MFDEPVKIISTAQVILQQLPHLIALLPEMDPPDPQHPRPGTAGSLEIKIKAASKLNSPMLEVPAPTMLDVPARQLSTLYVPMQLAFLICSNRLFSRTLDCITSGPSNPHDPGPLAGTAGRIVALIYIIAPIIMTIIQFAKYDYLRVCPRSPQCMYVVSFL